MTESRKTINDKGDNMTVLDTGDGIKVWNHEHGAHIGTGKDEEDARQMLND